MAKTFVKNDPKNPSVSGDNVTKEEREDLENSADSMGTEDDVNLKEASLEDTDQDGDLLNEGRDDLSGSNLDVSEEDEEDFIDDEDNEEDYGD